MRRKRGSARLLVACGAAALGAGGCSGATATIYNARPSPVPTATVRNGVCVTSRPLFQARQPARGLVTVDPHPKGLTAIWIPGLNQRPCRTARIQYGTSVATTLAQDIRTAPKFPEGTFNCPNDDASAVDLYFSYGAGQRSEYVWVGLRGCTSIGAPGRAVRRATDHLLRDLAKAAPEPWRAALTQWIG